MSNQNNESMWEAAYEKAEEEGLSIDVICEMDLEEVWEYLQK
jgi:hypothetical protein